MSEDPAHASRTGISGVLAGTHILLAEAGSVGQVVGDDAAARRSMTHGERYDGAFAHAGRGEPGGVARGYRVDRGAALVSVVGTLVPRGPVSTTSYAGLAVALRQAAADESVSSIVLTIDSPGGTVSHVDGAAAAILRARKVKPVVAMVEGQAASAAYWLASQCEAIVVAPLGSVGSIGAVQVHVDVSRAMGAAGLKVTLLHAGARKVDGNLYEPLADGARDGMQAQLDTIRTIFAQAVAAGRNRPGLDVAAVLATEARMFDARHAVGLGLADRIGTLEDLLAGQTGVSLPPPPTSSSTASA